MASDIVGTLLSQGQFDEAVCAFVKEQQHVSFPELARLLAPYMEVKGDWTYGSQDYPNILYWVGMSEAFSELVHRLHTSKRLFIHGADVLTYMVDGGLLSLPLAKRCCVYARPHWVPVVFCTYPISPKKSKSKHHDR